MRIQGKRIFASIITILILIASIGFSASFGQEYDNQKDILGNLELDVSLDSTMDTFDFDDEGFNILNYERLYASNGKSIKDIERYLDDNYEEYTKGEKKLEFKYDLRGFPSFIRVKMNGQNFKRTSSDWDDRNVDSFQGFVEDVAEYIGHTAREKVLLYVYGEDRDGVRAGKYKYDPDKREFKVVDEYQGSQGGDVEEELNEHCDEYTGGKEKLEFKYELKTLSNAVEIEMKGENFRRTSSDWKDRNDDKFEEFVEFIAKYVAENKNKDVKIYLNDENGRETGKYEYDESKDDFDVIYQYGEDQDVKRVEDELHDEYGEYKEGEEDLEFTYSLRKVSANVTVSMKGKNFRMTSDDWKDRNESKFEDFVEDIAEHVAKKFDKDVKIDLEDRDNEKTGTYEYDESRGRLNTIWEYDSGDKDNIEDKLNDHFDEYKDGKEDLDFDYNVKEESRYIKIEMKGENFTRKSSEWEDRSRSKFRTFIREMMEYVADETREDVKIYLEDEEDRRTGEYEYDKGKDEFDTIYEYGEDNNDSSEEEVEDKLNRDYDEYTGGRKDLEFTFEVDDTSRYVKVDMEGDFERDSSEWEDRDSDEFEKFVKEIAEYVAEALDKDVRIFLDDEEGEETGKYEYDESKDEFEVDSQYGENEDYEEVEDELNDRYEKYTEDRDDLEFKYELKEESSRYVTVKMKGQNFKRSSSEWKDRDIGDFKDFVEDVAKYVAKELDEDVRIYLEDEDNKETGEYKYDEDEREFETLDEYGEGDYDDVLDKLNDEYGEYTDGDEDLKFDYDLRESSREVTVSMNGSNFKVDSSEWEDRGQGDFRDFVEEMAEYLAEKYEKDIEIRVKDEDDETAARYEYDESRKNLRTIEENGGSLSIDELEEKLEDEYDEYIKGDKDLEFKYKLREKSSHIKVEMTGQNFKRTSSAWEDRNKSKFKDFIEEIAKEVANNFNKDVRVYVEDSEEERTARYNYDESKDDLEVDNEYK
ncbi:MAG: hypothetical protein MJA82_10235 [Clostridia bacterium]|nr:hypothetical protein [Clostridia bacterium]